MSIAELKTSADKFFDSLFKSNMGLKFLTSASLSFFVKLYSGRPLPNKFFLGFHQLIFLSVFLFSLVVGVWYVSSFFPYGLMASRIKI
jgi:hypothetical protein